MQPALPAANDCRAHHKPALPATISLRTRVSCGSQARVGISLAPLPTSVAVAGLPDGQGSCASA